MTRYTWLDGTPKSQGNAFNWRGKPSLLANPTKAEKVSIAKTIKPNAPGKSFTIYSRAKAKGAA